MGRNKVQIPKGKLIDLYLKEDKSLDYIAKLYNCNSRTVANRIKEYGIKNKTPAQARNRYKKLNFCGSKAEAAYMLGFRTGDLNVYLPNNKSSETVVVRCHTTRKDQADLFISLFFNYGKCTTSVAKNGRNMHINCFLNRSFDFLLPKFNLRKLNSIIDSVCIKSAFVAGYVDAEGTFGINQGKARFKLDTYDKKVMDFIFRYLYNLSLCPKYKMVAKRGQKRNTESNWNNDLWRININEAHSLKKFILTILPYLKHRKRINQANICLKNINNRLKRKTI